MRAKHKIKYIISYGRVDNDCSRLGFTQVCVSQQFTLCPHTHLKNQEECHLSIKKIVMQDFIIIIIIIIIVIIIIIIIYCNWVFIRWK